MSWFTHKEGEHSSGLHLRSFIPRRKKDFKWVASLNHTCKYDHGDADQYDWNKLCGVAFSIFAVRHSVMFGWRYNKQADRFEIAFYAHDGAGVSNRKMVKIAEVKTFEPIQLKMKLNRSFVDVWVNGEKNTFFLKKKLPRFKRLVFPWFGGNRPAPHTMNINLKTAG